MAGLIILPFVCKPGAADEMREPKIQALISAAFLFCAIKLWQKVDKPLAIFVGTVSICAHFSTLPYATWGMLAFGAALYTAFMLKDFHSNSLKSLMYALMISGCICGIYAYLQFFDLDPFMSRYEWAQKRVPTAMFGQQTLYGPWAASGFAAALFLGHYVIAAALLVPIIMIDSSFTYLSTGVVLFFFLVSKIGWKWTLRISCVVAVMFLTLAFNGKLKEELNDRGRFRLWNQVLFLANKRPIAGYGIGSFRLIYPVYQEKELRVLNGIDEKLMSPRMKQFIADAEEIKRENGIFFTVHNEFLEAYFEMGLIGIFSILLLFFGFYGAFFYSRQGAQECFLAAIFTLFMVNGVGNFIFHLIPQALLPLWAYVLMTSRAPPAILFLYEYTRNKRIVSYGRSCLRRCSEFWQRLRRRKNKGPEVRQSRRRADSWYWA